MMNGYNANSKPSPGGISNTIPNIAQIYSSCHCTKHGNVSIYVQYIVSMWKKTVGCGGGWGGG